MTNRTNIFIDENAQGCLDNEAEQFFQLIKKIETEDIDDVSTLSASTLHYLRVFHENRHKKFFISWNWSAYFLTTTWFAFRKMYFAAYGTIIVILAIMSLMKFDNFHAIFLLFFGLLAINILIGCFADTIYINRIRKKIVSKQFNSPNTSTIASVIVLVLCCGFYFIGMKFYGNIFH